MPSRTHIIFASLTIAIAFTWEPAGAEVYRWQDAQGNAIYSDQRVPHAEKQNLRTPMPIQQPNSGNQMSVNAADSKPSAKSASDAAQERCNKAKEILARSEKAQYLYQEGEDGNRIVLTDNEYQQELERMRQMAKKSCEGAS
jgi:hypothetical protein